MSFDPRRGVRLMIDRTGRWEFERDFYESTKTG
jgi:hypothetical protein